MQDRTTDLLNKLKQARVTVIQKKQAEANAFHQQLMQRAGPFRPVLEGLRALSDAGVSVVGSKEATPLWGNVLVEPIYSDECIIFLSTYRVILSTQKNPFAYVYMSRAGTQEKKTSVLFESVESLLGFLLETNAEYLDIREPESFLLREVMASKICQGFSFVMTAAEADKAAIRIIQLLEDKGVGLKADGFLSNDPVFQD